MSLLYEKLDYCRSVLTSKLIHWDYSYADESCREINATYPKPRRHPPSSMSALYRDSSPSHMSPKQESIANKHSCRPRCSVHSAKGKILAAFAQKTTPAQGLFYEFPGIGPIYEFELLSLFMSNGRNYSIFIILLHLTRRSGRHVNYVIPLIFFGHSSIWYS